MKLRFFILLIILAVTAKPSLPQRPLEPLTRAQITDLVKFGMDTDTLVKRIKDHGVDFEPTDDYLETLRKAGAQDPVIQALREVNPKPLTREQVGKLVAGGVPSQRAAALVKQRGIDFPADEDYLKTLRLAGADDTMIDAVREASAALTAQVVVATAPGAEVYLDGELQGRANPHGELAVKAKLQPHTLKVTLAGKKDFVQPINISSVQAVKVEARLADILGKIVVMTLPGASIFLDDSSLGTADASGQFAIQDVTPGFHELRASAKAKRAYRHSVSVVAGQESQVTATLADIPAPANPVRQNPKDGLMYVWIPAGKFMMGCSPGDGECESDERPQHQVTLTKGFWIGQTPVTVRAYKRFMAATRRPMPEDTPRFNAGWANDALPMVGTGWQGARDYCAWAGGRLPSEAEWEYAARGGSTEARYDNRDDISWYSQNSGNIPHDVAQKLPNGFGLFDVLGNVSQFVKDWYGSDYYQNSPSQDPPGPASATLHVVRGVAFSALTHFVRVSTRNADGPFNGGFTIGLRCVWVTK